MSHSITSGIVVLVRVLSVASQALIFVFLANRISVSDVGLFSAIYIFWGLMRMLGPLGLDELTMRDIAAFTERGETARAHAVTNFSVVVVGGVGFIIAGLTVVALTLVTSGGGNGLSLDAIAAAALGAPAYAFAGLLAAQLRSLDRTIFSQVAEVMLQCLALLLLVVLALSGELTLGTALVAHAVAAWSVVLVSAVVRFRCGFDLSQRLVGEDRTKTIRAAFQVWQALFLTGMAARIPTYISLAILGPAATAVLEIAIRFGTLPTIFLDGVATTFSPVFARLHAKGAREENRNALTLGSWLAFLPALSALVALAVLGPWLLETFFPPSYEASYWPLVLVCAAATVNAAFGLASSAFIVTGRQELVRLYSAMQLGVVAVGAAILAVLFGTTGVAAAMLVGVMLRDGGLARALAVENGGPVMLDFAWARRLTRAGSGTVPTGPLREMQGPPS